MNGIPIYYKTFLYKNPLFLINFGVKFNCLVVTAEECNVSMALVGCLLGGHPDDRDRPQRALPDDLPGVATAPKPALGACAVCALKAELFINDQ